MACSFFVIRLNYVVHLDLQSHLSILILKLILQMLVVSIMQYLRIDQFVQPRVKLDHLQMLQNELKVLFAH